MRKRTNASWEYEYYYGSQPEPQRRQLWYLVISVAIITATFITLILLS